MSLAHCRVKNAMLVLSFGFQKVVPYIMDVGQSQKTRLLGFPGGAVVKNPPANAGDKGSSPGLGRSHMPRSN